MRKLASTHPSAWYNLSSNKELDERGSRASISMEGLHLPDSPLASTDLKEMLAIARMYFLDLHTPIRPSLARYDAQKQLLVEVSAAYSRLPAPDRVPTSPFTPDELEVLPKKMPNTAPGPDGIPYSFYKSLNKLVDAANNKNPGSYPDFWVSFLNLANELRTLGVHQH